MIEEGYEVVVSHYDLMSEDGKAYARVSFSKWQSLKTMAKYEIEDKITYSGIKLRKDRNE